MSASDELERQRKKELTVVYLPISELKEYEGNAKTHDRSNIEAIKESIERFGNCDPIGVWTNPDGEHEIVEGHGRKIALSELGIEKAPCIILNHLTDEERRAYALAHNQTTLMSGFDMEALTSEIDRLCDFDMSDFGFNLDNLGGESYETLGEFFDQAGDSHGTLTDSFIVPPFSVLDAKSGRWQDRKKKWLEITGDLSETRDGEFGTLSGVGEAPQLMKTVNGGTSNFDPVLAEIVFRWFCPPDGKILDPFGGEQTKGVVAGHLGLDYTAVEIRQEQVDLNTEKTSAYENVRYVCGDSNDIGRLVDGKYDLCFTSPPYYDLEVYSKDDMSALGTYEEFMAMYENIFRQCYELLNDGSFLVVKVGEIRDRATGAYRNFVPDNVRIMTDIGFAYYNEIILLTQIATAAARARRNMNTRKVCKTHQNVLVFYKGDLRKIKDRFPPLDLSGLEDLDGIE